MSLGGFAFDDHVIDVYFHVPSDLVGEHLVHHPLVGCPCILQPEWHDFVEVNSSVYDECCMFLVFGHHLDLVVPRECIQEHEELVP